MTLVRIPGITKVNHKPEFDERLSELGYPPLDDLDEDSETFAEYFEGVLDERAALARRGWLISVDCKTGGYDPEFDRDHRVRTRGLGRRWLGYVLRGNPQGRHSRGRGCWN